MKEFLETPEVKAYMAEFGEDFKMAFVENWEDAKALFKYSLEPVQTKRFEIAMAAIKFGKFLEEEGVWTATKKLAKGIWESVGKTATTAEGHGEVAGETALAIATLGIGRAVKGLKTAGKAIEEVMDAVPDTKICTREAGVLDRPVKPHVDYQDWGNMKQQVLRKDVAASELCSPVEYGKFKNELIEEANIGHGNLRLLAENGLSIQDVERFGGQTINDLIGNQLFKNIVNKWGIGKDGTNQLLEHTIGKEIGRIAEVAKRAGIQPEELTDIFSTNPLNKIQGLKRFDELSDEMIKKSTMKNLRLNNGKQEAYYFPSTADSKKGVIVLKYNGKKDTMMPASKRYFDNNFKIETYDNNK